MANHVWLSLRKGGVREKNFPINQFPFVIGRSKEAQLPILDPGISSQHCCILFEDNRYFLQDMGSANGTLVGGKTINEKVLIEDGSLISLGNILLSFHCQNEDVSVVHSSEQTLAMTKDQLVKVDQKAPATGPIINPDLNPVGQAPDLNAINQKHWREYFPFLQWTADYYKSYLKHDLLAAISVLFLLIPQGMAYALLAGMPPIAGLYASMLPMVMYALFGSSRHVSVGPVSLNSILVALTVAALAQSGTDQYITLVILLALMIGTIQILMGILRIGFLVNFLSHPVLIGFMAAAASITIVSQLQHLMGGEHDQFSDLWTTLPALYSALPELNLLVLFSGLSCIAILFAFRRWAPRLPSAMFLVVMGAALSYFLGLGDKGFTVVGDIPMGLPALQWPEMSVSLLLQLLPYALALALISFAETISIAKSLADKKQYEIDANQELIGVGLANMASSMSQAMPVSGGLSRSRHNVAAGARSPLASIFTAVLIAATLVSVAPLFAPLPKVVLAAIIIVSVIGLIDVSEVRYLFRVKRSEGWLVLYTFIAALLIGIMEGLILGVIASMILFITLNTRPNAAILGKLPGSQVYRNILNYPQAGTIPGLAIVRIDASFYFANTEFLRKTLRFLSQADHQLKAVVLDASAINDLDSSADRALQILVKQFRDRGIDLYIAGIKEPVRDVMQRTGLYETLGANHFFYTIDAAVKRFQLREKSREAGEFF